jgi:DHA2 family multidrug resistance protein-like MFS transporter
VTGDFRRWSEQYPTIPRTNEDPSHDHDRHAFHSSKRPGYDQGHRPDAGRDRDRVSVTSFPHRLRTHHVTCTPVSAQQRQEGIVVFMKEITVPRAGRKEWIGLAVLILPTLLIAMDLTVLHLAVPALSRELAPTSSQLLWIVDIYGFFIAGSLITMGTLGDRIGRRKLLLIGAAAFGVASVIAAYAPSPETLIAARGLLGIAGATLMPSTMSLIRNMFHDPVQRTTAIGIWISGFSAGSAIGPLLGGWLLERFWWGSVFLLNVPVMVLLLVLGPLLLPEFRDPQPGRFDLLSAAQSLAAVLLVIFGLKRIAESGFGLVPAVTIVTGLLIGALFLRRQLTLVSPLLDLNLFRNRIFSASLSTNTIIIFFQFGLFLYIAQYLQLVLGLTPLQAGLWTLPGAVTFIIGSNLVPRVVRVIRPVVIVTTGLLIVAAGSALLTQVGAAEGLPVLVAASIVTSLGFSMVVTITVDLILAAAPPERAGAASAISETGFELGGALGIAILGSIGTAVYRSTVAGTIPAGVPLPAVAASQETLGGALAAATALSGPLGEALIATAREAFIRGFHLNALIGAVAAVGMAGLAMPLLRRAGVDPAPASLPDAGDAPVEIKPAA